jgi:hypothetical protein
MLNVENSVYSIYITLFYRLFSAKEEQEKSNFVVRSLRGKMVGVGVGGLVNGKH